MLKFVVKDSDLLITAWQSKKRFWAKPKGIKITHIPTGIESACDKHENQHINKAVAFQYLMDKLENM